MGIDFDAMYRKWHETNPIELFEAPVIKSVGEAHMHVRSRAHGGLTAAPPSSSA